MLASLAIRVVPLALFLPVLGFPQQVSAKPPSNPQFPKTLFVDCQDKEKPRHVLSSVSLSEDGKWRAYVEVDVRSDLGCLETSRLWVAAADASYRVLYFMPPKRFAVGNGMAILGWARHFRVLLVRTMEWQQGSDAPGTEQVLAVDAETGLVYEPELVAMLQAHDPKQCAFDVTDAGFSSDKNMDILVRAQFFTALEVDETEKDVPPAKRCENAEETWSFSFGDGEIKQVANTEPLLLFRTSPDKIDKHN